MLLEEQQAVSEGLEEQPDVHCLEPADSPESSPQHSDPVQVKPQSEQAGESSSQSCQVPEKQ
jgi:hypothetical protein